MSRWNERKEMKVWMRLGKKKSSEWLTLLHALNCTSQYPSIVFLMTTEYCGTFPRCDREMPWNDTKSTFITGRVESTVSNETGREGDYWGSEDALCEGFSPDSGDTGRWWKGAPRWMWRNLNPLEMVISCTTLSFFSNTCSFSIASIEDTSLFCWPTPGGGHLSSTIIMTVET